MSETHTIGQVAEKFGMTLRALRFYEDRGLIRPERRAGHRFYKPTHLERLEIIKGWVDAGVPLADIKKALGHLDAGRHAAALDLIRERIDAIEAELHHQLSAIASLRAEAA